MILPAAAAWEPMLRLGAGPTFGVSAYLLSKGCSELYAVRGISRTSVRAFAVGFSH